MKIGRTVQLGGVAISQPDRRDPQSGEKSRTKSGTCKRLPRLPSAWPRRRGISVRTRSFPTLRSKCRNRILDYRGNLTLWCQLSGYPNGASTTDVVVPSFGRNRSGRQEEENRAGQFIELDNFPCWYRVSYMFRRQAHTNPWTSMQF